MNEIAASKNPQPQGAQSYTGESPYTPVLPVVIVFAGGRAG